MRDELRDPLDADARRAREALDGLSAPPADPAFRAALAQRFASGAIAPAAAGETVVPFPRLRRPWHRTPAARWALAPVALAAAFLAVLYLDRGPGWGVMAANGAGVAVIDGRQVPLADAAALARALEPGARVRLPEGATLEIASGRALAIHATPGTEFTVPRSPGRWFSRAAATELASGSLRFTTGPGFAGARLAVFTAEASIEVTGTTLAVICDTPGTCVCVFEGAVRVGPRDGGAMEPVGAMRLRMIKKDGSEPKSASIRPTEAAELGAFRERGREYLDR